jgi:hypothetical protein
VYFTFGDEIDFAEVMTFTANSHGSESGNVGGKGSPSWNSGVAGFHLGVIDLGNAVGGLIVDLKRNGFGTFSNAIAYISSRRI